MSVGGVIVDIVEVSSEKWWINTLDDQAGRIGDLCAVYCNPLGHPIEVGDSLWWQGRECYWTPVSRCVQDVPLPKIGYSGVNHPHKSDGAQ